VLAALEELGEADRGAQRIRVRSSFEGFDSMDVIEGTTILNEVTEVELEKFLPECQLMAESEVIECPLVRCFQGRSGPSVEIVTRCS
jgi:hypothetical protein